MKYENMHEPSKALDWIVGIAAILAIVFMFVGLIAAVNRRTVGVIAYASEVRRGSACTLQYLKNDKLKKGDTVTWYVDGERVTSYVYDGESAEFVYTPTTVGTSTVSVVAGKYNKTATINVKKPLLTLTAKDITVTYGDEIPQTSFECSGLIGVDTTQSLGLNICCKADECHDVGVYEITFDEVDCADYEIAYNVGHLTIEPRQIEISTLLQKEYDQTNVLQCPSLELCGVLEGDEVCAVADELYFESKNVGEQAIVTQNIRLEGKNSANYTLKGELRGKILPKKITLEGLTVADKYFDGTTKANIEKPGKLKGVLDGDSVAIGNLDVSFEYAGIGDHKIKVKRISLVGLDKDNYVIESINEVQAKIKPIK